MTDPQLRHVGLKVGGFEAIDVEEAETGIFGFWVFLMSDAILFALLFAVYGTQLAATAGAPGPAAEFKIDSAFWETMVLLLSSFTYGMSSFAMKYGGQLRWVVGMLLVTLVLGLTFLGMEANDFAVMIHDGATPDRSGFLSAFFALVPTHGLHVVAGCSWIVVMLVQVAAFGLDDRVKINLLRLGLFWHFLDVIWIAIFSVVYLQGVMR
ncbi:cytochrome c oxidase subunit 3 [Lichenibacterium ramalinae]|uniref:Cytochrome bo(3) ubiquinol oxidase subunit 3 n=1 Tax=Lichenibacterium ramalinae TaxID=2316527 RepID=A0A4Q2RBY7_9HYPH|nr:cytochrome c oxidase subunit 3 [Lichenibacterium ramalinae]RYB03270.1 cytochrome o ubiquinol oxidase subunit III [Lichenibacterium ramalinae]